MASSAPQGSIRQGTSPRPDLLVFEIDGKISKPDIEWMAERAEAAFDRIGEIDMLIVMRNYQGADAAAAFDLESLKAQARSIKHVRRYAVVGAPAWARAMINASDILSPVDAKTFDLEDLDAAWAWVDQRDDAGRPAGA